MGRTAFFIILTGLIGTGIISCESRSDTVNITVGGEVFTVEIARTQDERARGLMFRDELEENHGMLFIFPEDRHLAFWMKNTTIPLSIAYISRDGTIREIRDMQPLSLRSVESQYAVRYALEVPQGNFTRLGIEAGDTVEIPREILQQRAE